MQSWAPVSCCNARQAGVVHGGLPDVCDLIGVNVPAKDAPPSISDRNCIFVVHAYSFRGLFLTRILHLLRKSNQSLHPRQAMDACINSQ